VKSIRLVLRIVFAALKSMILGQPFHRSVLVGTRQRERINDILIPDNDHLGLAVNIRTVDGWKRKSLFIRWTSARRGEYGQSR
jgi:hypothetical protein